MQKLKDLYPNARSGEQIRFEGSFIIKDDTYPCVWCGDACEFIEGALGSQVCSPSCFRAVWLETSLESTKSENEHLVGLLKSAQETIDHWRTAFDECNKRLIETENKPKAP